MLIFSSSQLSALSIIAADAGQVFLGATIVPFVVGFDKSNTPVLQSGLVITFACLIASVILARGNNDQSR